MRNRPRSLVHARTTIIEIVINRSSPPDRAPETRRAEANARAEEEIRNLSIFECA